MSVKIALAKLSAAVAGGALLAGGAVHVAEKPLSDKLQYKSIKQVKAKPKPAPKAPPRAARIVPKEETVARKRRIVRRVVECEPY